MSLIQQYSMITVLQAVVLHTSVTEMSKNTNGADGCCFNGGDCVLGSFCICPKKFFGRYCEFELGRANCGPVLHLGWFQRNCDMCFCYDGKTSCLYRALSGCEDVTKSPSGHVENHTKIYQPSEHIGDSYPRIAASANDHHLVVDYEEGVENSSCNRGLTPSAVISKTIITTNRQRLNFGTNFGNIVETLLTEATR